MKSEWLFPYMAKVSHVAIVLNAVFLKELGDAEQLLFNEGSSSGNETTLLEALGAPPMLSSQAAMM